MAKKLPVLIASTSGVRGIVGNGLDPIVAGRWAAAFATMLGKGTIVVGRDSRPSGEALTQSVIGSLLACGLDVIDIGIVPTPTVEIAVKKLKAAGGICLTASHNPAPWNALKFFSDRGEFVTPEQFKKLQAVVDGDRQKFVPTGRFGRMGRQDRWIAEHIRMTLAQKVIRKAAIKKQRFKVVVDAINGAGSFALPELLEKLGAKVIRINCNGDGNFVHEPEPKPSNLEQLSSAVKKHRADLGMACDPDADRLALVDEKGRPVSEEHTLTIAVMEVLLQQRGTTVINLSTSRCTADVAKSLASPVAYAKVGEANVVAQMRKSRAVIGGEGNGGVIYPSFHAGRDSLIAAALVLSALAGQKRDLSALVETFPKYYTTKSKAALPVGFDDRLRRFEREAADLLGSCKVDRRDGLRFDFSEGWVQIRRSNTEPIYRLIVETSNLQHTSRLVRRVKAFFK